MDQKPLTPQAIKKLSNMEYHEKVRLFARCYVIKQNSQIAGILSKAVGPYNVDVVKAEITHHLYDENDNYEYPKKYNELLNLMINKENVYKKFDDYTLCAYVLYFNKFIEYAQNSKNIEHIRYAKHRATKEVMEFLDRSRFNVDFIERDDAKTDSLLKKEYRRSLVNFLVKDLEVESGLAFITDYVNDEISLEDYLNSRPQLDPNKVYANQVEEYIVNGITYYLDTEGNVLDYEQIEDFEYNGVVLSATKNGLIEKIENTLER